MSSDPEQFSLIPLGGGASQKKERAKKGQRKADGTVRGASNTAGARADLLKYIHEVLGGKAPGQQLADLTTFTPDEVRKAKKWAKEMHRLRPMTTEDPGGYPMPNVFTVTELCFRFKVEKLRILFQITVKDAANMFLSLNERLMPLTHFKPATPVERDEDEDKLAPQPVDMEFLATIPQKQGVVLDVDSLKD